MTAHSPSNAEVKERVQLYLYSSCAPLCPVIVWTLHYLYLDCSCNSLAATFTIGRLSLSFANSQHKLRKYTLKSGFVCQMAPLNAAVNLAKWLLLKSSANLLQIIYSIYEISVSPQRTALFPQQGFSWNLKFGTFTEIRQHTTICLQCTTDTLHEDLCTYSSGNSALRVFRTEADCVLCRVLRAKAEDTVDDITIRRDR
jgi:hypothetical protein